MDPKDRHQVPSSNNEGSIPPLDKDLIDVLLRNQTLELKNHSQEVELKKQEMEINSRLAEKSLQMQREFMANRDPNFRKNVTRLAWIGAGFLIIIVGAILVLVLSDKDDFAKYFLNGLSYIVVTAISYYFGHKNGKAQREVEVEKDIQSF